MPSAPKKTLDEIARLLDQLGADAQSKDWSWVAQSMSRELGRKETSMILSSALATRFDWITRKQWMQGLSTFPMPDVWFDQLANSPGIPTASLQGIVEQLSLREEYSLAEAYLWAHQQPASLISDRLLARVANGISMGAGARDLIHRVRSQNSASGKARQFFAAFKKKLGSDL